MYKVFHLIVLLDISLRTFYLILASILSISASHALINPPPFPSPPLLLLLHNRTHPTPPLPHPLPLLVLPPVFPLLNRTPNPHPLDPQIPHTLRPCKRALITLHQRLLPLQFVAARRAEDAVFAGCAEDRRNAVARLSGLREGSCAGLAEGLSGLGLSRVDGLTGLGDGERSRTSQWSIGLTFLRARHGRGCVGWCIRVGVLVTGW